MRTLATLQDADAGSAVLEVDGLRIDDGCYEVTMRLHAAKRYAHGKGRETPAPLGDWIGVGVYAQAPSGEAHAQPVLYLQRHRIREGAPVIRVVVEGRPYEAGFDPDNKLIDRVSGDNRRRVTLAD